MKSKIAAENIPPEIKNFRLNGDLKKRGIEFYALEPYKFRKSMFIDCPYTDNKILLKFCKRCKKWLGSATHRKDYWLCKKDNN